MRPARALLVLLLAACAGTLAAAETRGFVVVVADAHPKSSITSAELARVFRKTVRRWDNGVAIAPVDQTLESAVRAQFSQRILGSTPGQVQEYWLRETFSGREVPPVVQSSDAAVLAYVRANAGAIGYVSASAALPPGVKPLTVSD